SVYHNSSLVCLNTNLLQPNVFYISRNTYRTQEYIRFQGYFAFRCFYFCLYAIAAGINARYFTISHYRNTLLLKIFFEFFGNIFVFNRYYSWQEFNDGYFSSHTVIKICELGSDSPGTNHDDRFWLSR